jgi:hypothetical protein
VRTPGSEEGLWDSIIRILVSWLAALAVMRPEEASEICEGLRDEMCWVGLSKLSGGLYQAGFDSGISGDG